MPEPGSRAAKMAAVVARTPGSTPASKPASTPAAKTPASRPATTPASSPSLLAAPQKYSAKHGTTYTGGTPTLAYGTTGPQAGLKYRKAPNAAPGYSGGTPSSSLGYKGAPKRATYTGGTPTAAQGYSQQRVVVNRNSPSQFTPSAPKPSAPPLSVNGRPVQGPRPMVGGRPVQGPMPMANPPSASAPASSTSRQFGAFANLSPTGSGPRMSSFGSPAPNNSGGFGKISLPSMPSGKSSPSGFSPSPQPITAKKPVPRSPFG
jgi:hypothetical protein